MEGRFYLSAFYDLEVVARTGDLISTGETITAIESPFGYPSFASINDDGDVAFLATLDDSGRVGSNILVGDSSGGVRRIGLPTTPDRGYQFAHMSDSGIVVAVDNEGPQSSVGLTGSGSGWQQVNFNDGSYQRIDYSIDVQLTFELGQPTASGSELTYPIHMVSGTTRFYGTAIDTYYYETFNFDRNESYQLEDFGGQLRYSFTTGRVEALQTPLPDNPDNPDLYGITYEADGGSSGEVGIITLYVWMGLFWYFDPDYGLWGSIDNTDGTRVRKWDGAQSGSYTMVADTAVPGPDGAYRLLGQSTLADDGAVSFLGLPVSGGRNLYYSTGGPGSETAVAAVAVSGTRPLVADGGAVVWRDNVTGGSAIKLRQASGAVTLLASPADGWTSLGNAPGISDDGQMIAFSGTHATMGSGIFGVRVDDPTHTVFKIAGVGGDGILDPNETWTDANFNGLVDFGEDAGPFVGFDQSTHVNINNGGGRYTVAALADSATATGLYTTPLSPGSGSPAVGHPSLVVETGGTLDGETVDSIRITDSLSKSGKLAFLVNTTSGKQLVVRAKTKNYAVLFSGGGDKNANHLRYYDNLRALYTTLTEEYDVLPGNIYILYADGTSAAIDRSDGQNSDMTFAADAHVLSATPAHLQSTLSTLAGIIGPDDHFFFWSFDHGAGDQGNVSAVGEEELCGWHGNISDTDLASWLSGINAAHSTYVFTQCFAGGMLDDLLPLKAGQFGASATNHYEPSYSDAFAAAFTAGLADRYVNTHSAYRYAYQKDGCANDGEGPGGMQATAEHPWSRGDDFRVFIPRWNHTPTLTGVTTLPKGKRDTARLITYDELIAAADEADPDGDKVCFRVEAVSSGTLTKNGVGVVPGVTNIGYGEALIWTPPNGATGTLDAFTLRAWDGLELSTNAAQVQVTVHNTLLGIILDVIDNSGLFELGTTIDQRVKLPPTGTGQISGETRAFQLTSSGSDAVTITGMALEGASPGSFILDVLPGTITGASQLHGEETAASSGLGDLTLAPGESVTIEVQFAPQVDGLNTAVLSFFTDDPADGGQPRQLLMEGIGVPWHAPTLSIVAPAWATASGQPTTITYASLFSASDAGDIDPGTTLSFRIESVTAGTLTLGGQPVIPGVSHLQLGQALEWTAGACPEGVTEAFRITAWDESLSSGTPVPVPVVIDSTSPTLGNWASAATHGSVGEILLVIPDGGSFCEPRETGIRRLVVDFSEAIAPATFSPGSVQIAGHDVDGNDLDLSGITISTSTRNGDTEGLVDFSPALPDMASYLVQIQGVTDMAGNPLAGDNHRTIGGLIGDATGDGIVDAADYISLKRAFASSVSLATASIDFDCSGTVDYGDLMALQGSIGQSLNMAFPAPEQAAVPAGSVAELEPIAVSTDEPDPDATMTTGLPVAMPAASFTLQSAAGILDALAHSGPSCLATTLCTIRPSYVEPQTRFASRLGLSISTSPLLSPVRTCPVVADVLQMAAPWWSGDSTKHEAPDEPWMARPTVDITGKPRKGLLDLSPE